MPHLQVTRQVATDSPSTWRSAHGWRARGDLLVGGKPGDLEMTEESVNASDVKVTNKGVSLPRHDDQGQGHHHEGAELDQGIAWTRKKSTANNRQTKRKKKRRARPTAGKEKKSTNSRHPKKEESVVGAGVPAPLHEERVTTRAKKRVCNQRDVTDECCHLGNFLLM